MRHCLRRLEELTKLGLKPLPSVGNFVLARYLTTYYLKRDASLRGDFAGEIEGIVTPMDVLQAIVEAIRGGVGSAQIVDGRRPPEARIAGS